MRFWAFPMILGFFHGFLYGSMSSKNLIFRRGIAMRMNMSRFIKMTCAVTVCLLARGGTSVQAADMDHDGQAACNQLPSHDALRAALIAAQSQPNGGSARLRLLEIRAVTSGRGAE
jgi:hypothetical protein